MDYVALRSSSTRLIRDMGKAATLRVPGAGTFDPVTGALTPGAPTDYAVHVVEQRYEQSEVDGTLVQANDRRFIVSAIADSGVALVAPSSAHKLIVGGVELAIVAVLPEQPGDIALDYTVQCRG